MINDNFRTYVHNGEQPDVIAWCDGMSIVSIASTKGKNSIADAYIESVENEALTKAEVSLLQTYIKGRVVARQKLRKQRAKKALFGE